jgi:hypothetical protein
MGVIFDSIVVDPVVFYGVIAGVAISMIVIVIILLKSKNKKQDYINLEPIIIEDKEEVKDIATSILDVKKETKEEPNPSILDIKEPVKIEEPVELTNIISKMEQDIVSSKKTVVANFETDQEEQAVISYKELLKLKDKIEPEIEKINIEIEELSPQVEEAVKKFKNTEFISPVFGRVDTVNKEDYAKELVLPKEEPAVYKKEVQQIKTQVKGEDFLDSLKNFRKNLD